MTHNFSRKRPYVEMCKAHTVVRFVLSDPVFRTENQHAIEVQKNQDLFYFIFCICSKPQLMMKDCR